MIIVGLALAACDADRSTDPPTGVPPTPRFARLTHLQWENTVRDLLHLSGPTGLSETFIGDPVSEGFDNDAELLAVTPELWQDYQRAAETLAASVVADPERYAAVVAEAERDSWLRQLGGRAFRRPLTDDEFARYAALFDQGGALYATGDDFADGVQLVLGAVLQSPHFLYRIEDSRTPDGTGAIPLSSAELASRLSYALWNTMPDEALFEAAASDLLLDEAELRAQAVRMLADPRAGETVADYHRQLLHLDSYANIDKDQDLFPAFRRTTPAAMEAEAYAFVDAVVAADGGLGELLTTRRTFANADLARIYGLEGVTGAELLPVELDGGQRAGLLTLSGFLALEADASVESPIRRGVTINRDVICAVLPPAPAEVAPLPTSGSGLTTREVVDAHTGEGTCGEGCHSALINPIGFAYGRYDALGQYREEDAGQPIDASGSYDFGEGARPFADAVELATLLADAQEVHACYAGSWLAYLEGRGVHPDDEATLRRLGRASRLDDLPVRQLIVEIVLSDGFRYRSDPRDEVPAR